MSADTTTENAQSLVEKFREEGFDKVKLGGFDIDGILRGKYVSLAKFESILESGLGFCDVIFGWDSSDELYEGVPVTFTGWHTGYPDTNARIDLSSYRQIPWEGGQPFFLLDFENDDGSPLEVSPRQLCQRVEQLAADDGFEVMAAAEFEFFVFRETSDTVREKDYRGMTALTPGMFGYSCVRAAQNVELFDELFSGMREFDIEIEGLHTETGPGVLEAAIRYDTMTRSADKGALFKTGTKEILGQNGLIATFMAKWNSDLPGSSGHLHQSLWKDGKPAFYDPNGYRTMSVTFQHYLAGVLHLLGDFTALYAPTINSYRRLVPGMWAPTRACWSPDNRTASLRTIHNPSPSSSRLETRVTGADINPHIALAATVAAGLYGIRNKLPLPPEIKGNAYEMSEADAPPIPSSLTEAVARLRQSAPAREMLGDAFVDHYCATREWEVRQAQKAVTDWELRRYFEII
ncbi:MAG: glutamine synthetase [Myxococcota bacterium]|jgi:glutamine synthetase